MRIGPPRQGDPPGTSRLIALGLAGCGLLVLVRSALEPVCPPGVPIEVRGEVPRPGLHLVVVPTVDRALLAAGAAPIGDPRPLRAGDRVELAAGGAEIRPPSDPVLVARAVDPNEADVEALGAIPGLSRRAAEAIVADRAERGPFRGIAGLDRVSGIGRGTLAQIARYLAAPAPGPLDLNLASAAELEALPGIGPALAQRIVDDREAHGPFAATADLARVPGIGPARLAAVRAALSEGGGEP